MNTFVLAEKLKDILTKINNKNEKAKYLYRKELNNGRKKQKKVPSGVH